MDLKKFLDKSNITQTEYASRVGISQPYLSQILKGIRFPHRVLAQKMSAATYGQVSVLDLLYPKNGKRKAA